MADGYESPTAWADRGILALDWRWLCRLSLVEPAVAVVWHLALSRSLVMAVVFDRTVLLFTSLWLVYMADRLLDVQRLPHARRPRTERHRFVYEHPRWVAGAWCAAFALAVSFSLANLSADEWLGGGIICFCTVLYLWLVHRTRSTALRLRERGIKELGVAALFVAGSTLFVWTHESFGARGSRVTLSFAMVAFFSLALQNLLALARHERLIDNHHNSPSIASTGSYGTILERALAFTSIALAAANLTLIATGTPIGGIPLAALLPINAGAALGSTLLLFQSRLFPSLNPDAQHVIADLAVLLGALPPLLLPAPFG